MGIYNKNTKLINKNLAFKTNYYIEKIKKYDLVFEMTIFYTKYYFLFITF